MGRTEGLWLEELKALIVADGFLKARLNSCPLRFLQATRAAGSMSHVMRAEALSRNLLIPAQSCE